MKETVMDDALIGTIVERRFVIDKVIGRGGISTVYKVKHLHADIEACIKILHSSYTSTEESVERFRREAAITNAINHANVVHMLSYGVLRGELERSEGFEPETVKEPRPYLILELLKGAGLDRIIRKGAIGQSQSLQITRAVLDALIVAHEMGIIHRDIKPSNVMIVESISEMDQMYSDLPVSQVKLLDFGIAKCNACHDAEVQRLTQAGSIFGSPLYMSPEQCKGDDLDQRSDIYSLGCMLYEMLTGIPPYQGQNVMHTFAMHIYEQPRSFNELADMPAINPQLEAIVMRCLAKDRKDRFQNGVELKQALASIY
ncbi:MAG: serine/threonine protein kinase [Candidatus Obscuribacter sp.]|nr:serine/threonine protein kinase [Candidatus Obscuribacter sp.]